MNNQMMTGVLSPNTVFQEDGHQATLSDFKEGDVVLVQWKPTRNGKIIEYIGKGAEAAEFSGNK
jgi:hypothetical protein